MTVVHILIILLILPSVYAVVPFEYHNHDALTDYLNDVVQNYPAITHLYSIGYSVENRELWVMAIAGSDPDQHVELRPEVKYVGNMHGDETVGRELLIHFIEHLVTGYGNNNDVTSLLDSSRVHILVSMNPDGFEYAYDISSTGSCDGSTAWGRYNANGYDLNRNFPDLFTTNNAQMQAETAAVLEWIDMEYFVLSANLHGGAVVANYPYDNNAAGSAVYSPTQDDDVFRQLATTYASNHANMAQGNLCGFSFPGGITNGADWYPLVGGMQDYNYWSAGCMELTLEVSCCKFDFANTLQSHWNDNRESLMQFLLMIKTGVKGLVANSDGSVNPDVELFIEGREDHEIRISDEGEFWRILLPGEYFMLVSENGEELDRIPFSIPTGQTEPLLLNIVLDDGTDGCTEMDLSLTSQEGYSMSVVTADDPASLDAYEALDSDPLIIPIATTNGARIAIDPTGGDVSVSLICMSVTEDVKRVKVMYVDAAGLLIDRASKRIRSDSVCFDKDVQDVSLVKLLLMKQNGATEVGISDLVVDACAAVGA